MKKIYLASFCISSVTAFLLLHFLFQSLIKNQKVLHREEVEIIHENVQERFKVFLDAPLAIGTAAADIISGEGNIERVYDQFGSNMMKYFGEILGLNVLDDKGMIDHVFPAEENVAALGRVSQNYQSILASAQKREAYWLSPPFELFQGDMGFAFYIPFYKNHRLKGWIAPVVSSELFFQQFRMAKFLHAYHLAIIDVESGKPYFSSGQSMPERDVYKKDLEINGRKIRFLSWRKGLDVFYQAPWYVTMLLALGMGMVATYILKIHLERKEVSQQLQEIDTLLQYTTVEATRSLIEIHRELSLIGKLTGYVETQKVAHYVVYTTNLIEQIKVLNTLAKRKEEASLKMNLFYPLFREQLKYFQESLQDKEINFTYDPTQLEHLKIWSNEWLFSFGVLGNVFRDIIQQAARGSEVKVIYNWDKNSDEIIFFSQIEGAESTEWSLSLAKEVIQLSEGEIIVREHDNERTLSLRLPRKPS